MKLTSGIFNWFQHTSSFMQILTIKNNFFGFFRASVCFPFCLRFKNRGYINIMITTDSITNFDSTSSPRSNRRLPGCHNRRNSWPISYSFFYISSIHDWQLFCNLKFTNKLVPINIQSDILAVRQKCGRRIFSVVLYWLFIVFLCETSSTDNIDRPSLSVRCNDVGLNLLEAFFFSVQ